MCVHKAWNLKYDTREMTAATNEDCIGLLFENCCWRNDGEEMKLLTAKDLNLLRRIFVMGEMSKFLAVG